MARYSEWFDGPFRTASVGVIVATTVAAALLSGGCGGKWKQRATAINVPPEAVVNAQIFEMGFAAQARNGAATGHTIYPHHFVIGDAELTLVGQRHFNALLPRNGVEPVRISVPRGNASDALYQARLATLRLRFADSGYGDDRFALVDELPGGDGISSERAVLLASEEPRAAASGRQDRSQTGNRPTGQPDGANTGGRGNSGGSYGGGGSSSR